MSESKRPTPERHETPPERAEEPSGRSLEQEPLSAEKLEQERQEELEGARRNAEKESVSIEKPSPSSEEEPIRITKADKQHTYRLTMSRVQSKLPPLSRRFSRLIHSKGVERASEAIGKTVARPSGILGGAVVATFGLAVMLFFARRNGFELSGSELIIFLVAGWIIGVSLEGVATVLHRRR